MTKRIISILALLFLLTSFLLAQQTEIETIYFDSNKFELTEETKELLNKKLRSIDIDQVSKITIKGHTDADGSNEYNLMLSKNRSIAVNDFLISNGISKEKLINEFYGALNPVAQNDNDQNKYQNRLVEVIFEIKEIVIKDIFEKLKKDPQIFKVDPTKAISITGKEGTTIFLPPNSLVNKNLEPINKEIEIKLVEFYRKSDIISSNLHTISGNRILETGGMINIVATLSGEILQLGKDKMIGIKFASQSTSKRMETFIGRTKNNELNWVRDSSNYAYKPINVSISYDPEDREEMARNKYNRKDTVGIRELEKVDGLLLSSGELGWINCDRFYISKDKTNLIVDVAGKYKPVVRLVFKDINSVMPGNHNGNKITFNSIPVGQKATLLAFSLVNDVPYYVSNDITISKDLKENLMMVKTTMTQLKLDLEKLN